MRISDWSSDVCSSDLAGDRDGRADRLSADARHAGRRREGGAAGAGACARRHFGSGAMSYDEVRHFADSWGLIVMVAMFLLFVAWPFRKGARRHHDEAANMIFKDDEHG